MTRKGKRAPGGHNPLTYHERQHKLLNAYGTQTVRLGTDGQGKFGYCCLGLGPAVDPVVTPSGHIYSREAILAYLLQQTQTLKSTHAQTTLRHQTQQAKRQKLQTQSSQKAAEAFLQKDQGAMQQSQRVHAKSGYEETVKRRVDVESQEEGRNVLKRTSYWLAEFNPHYKEDEEEVVEKDGTTTATATATGTASSTALVLADPNSNSTLTTTTTTSFSSPPPPPQKQRPTSPMSGQPLRLKDLHPIDLLREKSSSSNPDEVRFLCALSHKTITTQPAVAILKTRQVLLTSVYQDLVVKEDADATTTSHSDSNPKKRKKKAKQDDKESQEQPKKKKKLTCPITGKSFSEKDVVHLQKAASGFAASGKVEAKVYRPTLT